MTKEYPFPKDDMLGTVNETSSNAQNSEGLSRRHAGNHKKVIKVFADLGGGVLFLTLFYFLPYQGQ